MHETQSDGLHHADASCANETSVWDEDGDDATDVQQLWWNGNGDDDVEEEGLIRICRRTSQLTPHVTNHIFVFAVTVNLTSHR